MVGKKPQSGEEADIENNLVLLLDMDKFALVKLLLKNRLKIVWCTRLARAQNEEEVARLEAEMEANADTVKILKELHATRASARDRQNAMERRCVAVSFSSLLCCVPRSRLSPPGRHCAGASAAPPVELRDVGPSAREVATTPLYAREAAANFSTRVF